MNGLPLFIVSGSAPTGAAAAVQPRKTRLRSERCKYAANGKKGDLSSKGTVKLGSIR